MRITLHVEPSTPPMSGVDFMQYAPPLSIALDGFVGEGPWYVERHQPLLEEEVMAEDGTVIGPAILAAGVGPYRNFNHHEGVDRSSTRATCGQVLMAVRQGLFGAFRENGEPTAHVYVNDCDEDVCLSWFLLHNAHISMSATNPLINRVVEVVDKLDTTAGAYPLPKDSPVLGELAWIFNPYRRFRLAGGLKTRDADQFKSVIENVEGRLLKYILGQGKSIALDTRYDRIGGGQGWSMVRELGPQSRTGMFGDGIEAFCSVSNGTPGRYDYVIGRVSEYVPFPVPDILDALNDEEGLCSSSDQWGGSNTIGGSPRVRGSRLCPDDVARIIEDQISSIQPS